MKKTVLITGSSRGIGKAIAQKFAAHGYQVAINYYKSKGDALALEQSFLDQGINAMAVGCDVSKLSEVEKMFQEVRSRFGDIHVLVNNAGIAETKLFTDIDPAYWDRIFDVNVKGMFHCTRQAVPSMISNKRGRIINISSIWGMVGASMETHYAATKGAINAFTKSLAKELGPSGITVNAVAPGAIYTDMISGLDSSILDAVKDETPLGILGSPEQVADMVYFLAESTGDYITGQILSPNGGLVI